MGRSTEKPEPANTTLAGKRVGMVVFSAYPADPRPRRAVETLLREGMSVDLVCLGEGDEPKQEQIGELRIRRIPITQERGGKLSYAYRYTSFILMATALLAARMLRRRYHLIYIHNMPDVLVASALFPKALGARVILDLHDPMPELMTTIYQLAPESAAVRLIQRLEKWSLARAHRVLTVNTACQRIFGERSCPVEMIGVVMNSPDDRIFPLRAPEPPADAGADKPFVIMYHGSIVERNGLDLALQALALLRHRIPSAELRVYGRSTPFLEQVLQQAGEKGLSDRVKHLGPKRLEELVAEIGACDIGVIPNQRNAFTDINTPTRIFEYLVLGKPVVAPRTRGITDYFDDHSLFFFESGNAADLAAALERAWRHPRETYQTAVRGQQVYQAHTWPEERKKLVATVEQLLAANAPKPALAVAVE